jgi:hypothetical protein
MSADWEPGHRQPERPVDEPDPSASGRRTSGDSDSDGSGRRDAPDAPDASRLAWLIVGAVAIAGGTALGWDASALSAIVTPPPFLRAALVGVSAAIGVVLLLNAVNRLAGDDDGGSPRLQDRSGRDIGAMIRGVRLVFLAVAAFAAASGWVLGHPLPLVVALIIAGVDVLETSFLLIVVGLHRPPR